MQSVNWWAVLAAIVSSFFIGGIWYSPMLFVTPWLRMSGVEKSTFDSGLPRALLGDLFTSTATALALNHVLRISGANDLSQALCVVVWVWLAFVAAVQLSSVTYEQRPFRYFAINTGYRLVSMLIMGIILTLWR